MVKYEDLKELWNRNGLWYYAQKHDKYILYNKYFEEVSKFDCYERMLSYLHNER